jgi:hypothetical protein
MTDDMDDGIWNHTRRQLPIRRAVPGNKKPHKKQAKKDKGVAGRSIM